MFIWIIIVLISLFFIAKLSQNNIDYDDDCRLNTQHQQSETISTTNRRKFWRSLLARFIPNIRISIIIVSLIWFGWKILDEFRCWQRSNQRIQIQPFINDSPSSMMMNKVEISVLHVFGNGPGTRPGLFDRPAGITINSNLGQLIVADKDNHRIQVFVICELKSISNYLI